MIWLRAFVFIALMGLAACGTLTGHIKGSFEIDDLRNLPDAS